MGGVGAAGAVPITAVRLKGTVAGARLGMVALTMPNGDQWLLTVTNRTEVRVTGTATPDVLVPGTYVRFIAPVETRRSLVQGKVGKVTVFSPSQEMGRMPGVFIAGQEGEEVDPAAADTATPAGGGRAGVAGGRQAQATPNVESFDIRGRLTSVKGKWLTVSAENTFIKPTLRFELADEVEVGLDVNTYSLAQTGDRIECLGVPYGPQTIEAIEMSIELTQRVGEQEKPATRRGSRASAESGAVQSAGGAGSAASQNSGGAGASATTGSKPAQDDAGSAPQDDRTKQIVEVLQATAEEVKNKSPVTLKLGEGVAKTFAPCKQVSGKDVLVKRFGVPDQSKPVTGSLVLDGRLTEVRWQLWVYGPAMVFVDEADTTRYLCVEADGSR